MTDDFMETSFIETDDGEVALKLFANKTDCQASSSSLYVVVVGCFAYSIGEKVFN